MKRLIIPAALIVLLAVTVALTILIQSGSAETTESFAPVTTTQTTHYVKVPNIIRDTEASTMSAETRQAQVGQGVQTGSIQSGYTLPATGQPKDTPPNDSNRSSG